MRLSLFYYLCDKHRLELIEKHNLGNEYFFLLEDFKDQDSILREWREKEYAREICSARSCDSTPVCRETTYLDTYHIRDW